MNEAFFPPGHEEYLPTTVEPTLNASATHPAKTGDATLIGQRPTYEAWLHEQLCRSRLSENVLVLGRYASGPLSIRQEESRPLHRCPIYRLETLSDEASMPEQFYKTARSQFFRQTFLLLHTGEPLILAQMEKDLGITQQHLYDHVTADQLHLIFVYGKMRLCVLKGSGVEIALHDQDQTKYKRKKEYFHLKDCSFMMFTFCVRT